MKNPYKEIYDSFAKANKEMFDSIAKAIVKLSNMICWLAERTLSVKDFKDFIDAFPAEESKRDKPDLTEIMNELRSKSE